MHTPDGFITSWVCVAMLLASGAALAYAFHERRQWLGQLPRMALAASVVFLLQMLNFPVLHGTSGHFLGAALAALLLGPSAALVVMASVIAVQAVVFGDGGFLAIGVNAFNMAVVAVAVAHYTRISLEPKLGGAASFAASAWASVVAASISASVLLAVSGTAPLAPVLAAMVSVHAIIGAGEAAIGFAALSLLRSKSRAGSFASAGGWTLAAVALASLAIPFASHSPDGLYRVAIDYGFYRSATTIYSVPLPGYVAAFLPPIVQSLTAALVGALACFALVSSLAAPAAFKAVQERK